MKYWNRIVTLKKEDWTYVKTRVRACSIWDAIDSISKKLEAWEDMWEVVGINEPEDED